MSAGSTETMALFAFEGHQVRVARDEHGVPWFVASDLARVLGFRDGASAARAVREHHKGIQVLDTLGGPQQMVVISKPGLNRLLLRAETARRGRTDEERERLRECIERFQDWVTDVVLPSIDEKGSFSITPEPQPEPSTEIDLVNNPEAALAMLTKVSALALKEIQQRKAAEAQVAELEPKAQAWAAMVESGKDYSVGDAAKLMSRAGDIEIGEVRLFAWLREGGHIFEAKSERGRKSYSPYQRHIAAGRLAVKMGKPWWNDKDQLLEQGSPQVRMPGHSLDYWLDKLRADGRFARKPKPALALVSTH